MYKITNFMLLFAFFYGFSFGQSSSIKVGSTTRTFIVYTPNGLAEHPPLVISMHGLGGSGSQQRSYSGFDKVADKGKFIVVYPDGTFKMNGSNGWDISSDADVKFISALIDTLVDRYKIDKNRIFASGFSMGGMMSYKLACTLSDKIAAIGPASGYPLGNMITSCTPSRPISICHTHGTIDSIVPYSGLEKWVAKFVKSNECPSTPTTTTPTTKYKREYWGPCDKKCEIILYHFDGMSHGYVNTSQYSFSASDTFWTFFQKHPLNSDVKITSPISSVHQTGFITAIYSQSAISIQAEMDIYSVTVSDMAGRYLITKQTTNGHAHMVSVPVNSLSSGIYFINVTGAKENRFLRVLIP